MIRDVPTGEWGSFLEPFGLEHRAWLATVHVVDARGTVTRSARIPLKSAAASADAVTLEFIGDAHSLSAHRPCALRIQETESVLSRHSRLMDRTDSSSVSPFEPRPCRSSSMDSHPKS